MVGVTPSVHVTTPIKLTARRNTDLQRRCPRVFGGIPWSAENVCSNRVMCLHATRFLCTVARRIPRSKSIQPARETRQMAINKITAVIFYGGRDAN